MQTFQCKFTTDLEHCTRKNNLTSSSSSSSNSRQLKYFFPDFNLINFILLYVFCRNCFANGMKNYGQLSRLVNKLKISGKMVKKIS